MSSSAAARSAVSPPAPEADASGASRTTARGLARLPIRLRLTLVFATAMLLVLSLAGVLVYEHVRTSVDNKIDVDVSKQAAELLSIVESSPGGLAAAVNSPLVSGHENFVQVLDPDGRIVAATPGLSNVALLSGKKLQEALTRSVHVTRGKQGDTDPLPDGSRLVALPIRAPGRRPAVLVVGTSLDQQSNSLSNLSLILLIVGPLALFAASFAGYRLTAAALRPVERMRQQAAIVSARQPGLRLPLPTADDEIHDLGTTLNEMLDRLEDSFAREQAFVANASHELRTPLATLRTELDLALRRPRTAGELHEALVSAQTEVERMSALADDLLVLARADNGRLPMRPVTLDVLALLQTIRQRFDPTRQRIALTATERLEVNADPDRLEQALGNLVDNALRYGAGAVTLSVRQAPGGTGVELHVSDNGAGFPEDFIEHAFERFSRADPGRAGRGAGLGLSIVEMIARAHGGSAHATNLPDGGADVWLVIASSPDG